MVYRRRLRVDPSTAVDEEDICVRGLSYAGGDCPPSGAATDGMLTRNLGLKGAGLIGGESEFDEAIDFDSLLDLFSSLESRPKRLL
jgi:hypothetical protein